MAKVRVPKQLTPAIFRMVAVSVAVRLPRP